MGDQHRSDDAEILKEWREHARHDRLDVPSQGLNELQESSRVP